MDNLQERVESYLISERFDVISKKENLLIAQKDTHFGSVDTFLVWVVPTLDVADDDLPKVERKILDDFEQLDKRYSKSKRIIVTHSRGEFSNKFKVELGNYNVSQRSEVEFFDAPFRTKTERGTQATSAIEALRDTSIAYKRIPQPYKVYTNGEFTSGASTDLFSTLYKPHSISIPNKPSLNLIVGPAGIGKTYLFRALFSSLYETFIERKKKLEIFPRPIPLITSYLRHGTNKRVDDVLTNFIQTEVTAHIESDTFKWMLLNNYAIWLFDGLDELYSEDEEFFYTLMELLETPNSKAQILLFSRESLLSSSKYFSEFLQAYPPSNSKNIEVNLFKIDRWDRQSKRVFAWNQLMSAEPEKGEVDPPEVARFISFIDSSEVMRNISSLPFYTKILLDEYKANNNSKIDFNNDFDLLGYSLQKIVDREIKKEDIKGEEIQLLNLSNFIEGGFDDWLQTVASEYCARNFKGVDVDTIEVYASAVLHSGLSNDEKKDTITSLIQFPLFSPSAEPKSIGFQHELTAEYLAGIYWSKRIDRNPARAGAELGTRTDFADSLLARFLAQCISNEPSSIKAICDTLKWEQLKGRAFSNLLQILIYSTTDRTIIKNSEISFDGKDLSYVKFYNQDLRNMSFNGCDLTNTIFNDCDLANSVFEGALLVGTRFENFPQKFITGTRFGNLEFFESIYVKSKLIEDQQEMIQWLLTATGISEVKSACPTALQLRQLFLKYIDPFGNGKRDKLKYRALEAGKRYSKAPLPSQLIGSCIKYNYLQEPDFRDYVSRNLGIYYDEMVDYITKWKISPRIGLLIGDFCEINNCKHSPGIN